MSVLKAMTREQLLGNYSKLSSFVTLFILIRFTLSALIGQIGIRGLGVSLISGLIFHVLTAIFTVGFIRVCALVIHGKPAGLNDFFYVFSHDPDKIVIIGAIQWFFSELPFIPLYMSAYSGESVGMTRGTLTLVSYGLFAVLFIVYVYAYIMLSQSYFIYLSGRQYGALEAVYMSIAIMKAHRGRYFYLLINIIGMLVLAVITLGIGLFWIMPNMYVLMINFYEDIAGAPARENSASEESPE